MAATVGAMTAMELATAATTATSMAATAYSFIEQSKMAKQQKAAAEAHNKQVIDTTIANYDQMSEVEQEAQSKALEDSMAMQEDYLVEKGRINVMAAYSGTGGLSVASQLKDLERQKYENFNTIQLNQQAEFDNIADQAESARYQAKGEMSVTPISRPSYASTALQMGTQAMGGYAKYEQLKAGG